MKRAKPADYLIESRSSTHYHHSKACTVVTSTQMACTCGAVAPHKELKTLSKQPTPLQEIASNISALKHRLNLMLSSGDISLTEWTDADAELDAMTTECKRLEPKT